MAKIRKAVFRSGIVMMSLLAAIVLSGGVAQAQECVAFAKQPATTARADGPGRNDGGHRRIVCAGQCPSDNFAFAVPVPR